MRAVVTGAAGFLGSHLCEALLAEGHSVLAVDNLLTGSMQNISHLASCHGFDFLEQDVTQPFEPGRCDYIFHFASPASPPDYLEHGIMTLKLGSLATFHLIDAALRHGARFLLASTSECYGDPLEHPQKESYWGNVNPIGPRSVYDEAKRFAEAATMAAHRYQGLDSRIVRIFNTYGPRMRARDGRVVPNFIAQALAGEPLTVYGDGIQTRSFCYVDDLIGGIMRLSSSDWHQPMNLGNPAEFTMLECAELVLKITGAKSSIRFEPLPQDDPKRRCPDISLAQRELKWSPEVPLEEGLRRTINYFANGTLRSTSAA